MAKYRKLGKTSSQRKALMRNQVTQLIYHGKITTTEARAKEIRKVAEGLIALAVKERDNYETVEVEPSRRILLQDFMQEDRCSRFSIPWLRFLTVLQAGSATPRRLILLQCSLMILLRSMRTVTVVIQG